MNINASRRAVVLLAPALLLVWVAGCTPETRATDPSPAEAPVATQSDANAPTPNFSGNANMIPQKVVSISELPDLIGVPTTFPEKAFGGIDQALTSPDGGPDCATVLYKDKVAVRVWKLNATDALVLLRDLDDDSGFSPWVKHIEIQGFEARAHDKLNVPAEWDERGIAKPGTGVTTGSAMVMWAQGPYVVSVSSPEIPLDELIKYAEQVKLDTRAP